jgi:GT2 family glycosyltransferase
MGREQPFFSIIVPTYNRPEQLAACLRALARLDYPRARFEVIVVDDGGRRQPDEVVASFHGQLDVTLLRQSNAGPATARNTGAARARGEFLAFTDDDCMPAPDWLNTFAGRFAKAPDCAIGGRTINALQDNIYSTASQLLIAYLYAYYNAMPHQARFLASNNLAVPTGQFRAIGGFDMTFPGAAAEDREFCDRWLSHSYHLIYAQEAIVQHAHALTCRAFWRQHFSYGRGAFCFHQTRAKRGVGQIKVEPFAFYRGLLRYPLAHTQGARALLLAGLLVTTQIANVSGFFWERARRWVHD